MAMCLYDEKKLFYKIYKSSLTISKEESELFDKNYVFLVMIVVDHFDEVEKILK